MHGPEIKHLYIMRGLPGSGKSTWIKKNLYNPFVCSADSFFETPEGYRFDRKLLDAAHQSCKQKFEEYTRYGSSPVVVDNCNLLAKHFKEYVDIGEARGYRVKIVTIKTPPEECVKRQTHGVPVEHYKTLVQRFRTPLPKEYADIEYIVPQNKEPSQK